MVKRKLVKEGDVFSIKVRENNYIFGRIVFRPKDQYTKNMVDVKPQDNPFFFFNNTLLIEMYSGVYESAADVDYTTKAVNGVFVSKNIINQENFQIIDFKAVDPIEVYFPESLSIYENEICFISGELRLELPINHEEYEEIKIHPSFDLSTKSSEVATLKCSNREDLLSESELKNQFFIYSDLHYSPEIRGYIYSLLNEDSSLNYYELSKKHGFDLSRLY